MKKQFLLFVFLLCVFFAHYNYAQVSVQTDKETYNLLESITVSFNGGPGNPADWIGIYKTGDIPGATPSILWYYVNGSQSPTVGITDGSLWFSTGLQLEGDYWVGFFDNDSYNILTADTFHVSSIPPMVTTDKGIYDIGDTISVSFINGPNNPTDWIGIYKLGDIPGVQYSTLWYYVNGTQSPTVGITDGSVTFTEGLIDPGIYWAGFFENDGYTMLDSMGFIVTNLSDSIAPAPPANIVVNAGSFINLIIWDDVPGETNEKYFVYASTHPITNINSDDVELVASDIEGGTQVFPHALLAPVSDQSVTYYYAVVCKDYASNFSDPGLSAPATNIAKGMPVIQEITVPDFSPDGLLTEWQGLPKFRMYVSDGSGHICTNTVIDNDADLSADVYLAIDQSYLYVAFDITDDFFNPVNPVLNPYELDCPDLYIGLYNYKKEKHSSYQRGSTPDYHLRFNEGVLSSTETTSWCDSLVIEGPDYYYGENFPDGYIIEARIPLTDLATKRNDGYTGTDIINVGYADRIAFDLGINDNDDGSTREGMLFYSALDNDNGWNNPKVWTHTWITNWWLVNNESTGEEVYSFSLDQNYPNPFNPATLIRYSIPEPGLVTLKVYDILGKEVATLVNEQKVSGNYEVKFNAGSLASGVYFYTLKINNYVSTEKMILLK